ncbi:MAG: 50S ribosomal protein L4 [candidate division Zixibacteria bacterium]|nr:50S ribosomal protein L4 [candidate division Zixibacteria bacterium]
MLNAVAYDKEGNQIEAFKLDERLFGQNPNLSVIHQYVKAYSANQGQGTVKKKNRVEVRGGGAKPWRQKGTGRARAGTNTSPIWVGGGRAFPPVPHDCHIDIPKKMKRKALLSTLSAMASENRVKIIQDISLDVPKTKVMAELFDKMGIGGAKILFLSEGKDDNLYKSLKNLKGLVYKRACLVNPYDLLTCDFLVMTKMALDGLTEVFAG